jgi:hypothetical protein
MRWPFSKHNGVWRVRCGFLFRTKTCFNPRSCIWETRWLEKSKWQERLVDGKWVAHRWEN